MPTSSSPTTSRQSPNAAPSNPNINHFSPLSPHMEAAPLPVTTSEESDIAPATFKVYTRRSLLLIAQTSQQYGWTQPKNMCRLEDWFGLSPMKASFGSFVEDPAIASVEHPSSMLHKKSGHSGFGEGFGFGGGIGAGRGVGRVGRSAGLRRQADLPLESSATTVSERRDGYGGQMGRFSMKPATERSMRLGGDEGPKSKYTPDRRMRRDDVEWRRGERGPDYQRGEESRRHWSQRQATAGDDDISEPAWMADSTQSFSDPAVAASSGSDGLVQFVPGEDMIAAHRRHTNVRDRGSQQQIDKPLVSFFGSDKPPSAMPSSDTGKSASVAKSKNFDAADYLLPSKTTKDDTESEGETAHDTASAFQSRFQKLFAGAPPLPPLHDSPSTAQQLSPYAYAPTEDRMSRSDALDDRPSEQQVDGHMARLMGLLSTKTVEKTVFPSASSSAETSTGIYPAHHDHLTRFPSSFNHLNPRDPPNSNISHRSVATDLPHQSPEASLPFNPDRGTSSAFRAQQILPNQNVSHGPATSYPNFMTIDHLPSYNIDHQSQGPPVSRPQGFPPTHAPQFLPNQNPNYNITQPVFQSQSHDGSTSPLDLLQQLQRSHSPLERDLQHPNHMYHPSGFLGPSNPALPASGQNYPISGHSIRSPLPNLPYMRGHAAPQPSFPAGQQYVPHPNPNPAQQDMLAALFSGLPRPPPS